MPSKEDTLIIDKILDNQGVDLAKLHEMQQNQLAETYAGLLTHLKEKQVSIEKRMKKVLQGYGIMDKVLIQTRNYELDPDSINNETDQVWFPSFKEEEHHRTNLHRRLKI